MAHSAPHSRPPPRNTPWHDPWPTKRRARVSHARNASVTLAIRNLGMKRRRTSYPTPKSTHALSVSEFWVIFPEGPKRQPTAPWGMVHRHRRRHRQTTLLPYSRTASRSVRPLITAREARTDLRGKPRPTERTNARALPCRISTQTANAKRLSPEPREGCMRIGAEITLWSAPKIELSRCTVIGEPDITRRARHHARAIGRQGPRQGTIPRTNKYSPASSRSRARSVPAHRRSNGRGDGEG